MVEKSKRTLTYTDFTDELGELTKVTLTQFSVGADLERFRAKVRDHEDHVALQIHFIDLVINCLTDNGVMDASRLYEPPFTDLGSSWFLAGG